MRQQLQTRNTEVETMLLRTHAESSWKVCRSPVYIDNVCLSINARGVGVRGNVNCLGRRRPQVCAIRPNNPEATKPAHKARLGVREDVHKKATADESSKSTYSLAEPSATTKCSAKFPALKNPPLRRDDLPASPQVWQPGGPRRPSTKTPPSGSSGKTLEEDKFKATKHVRKTSDGFGDIGG